MEKSNIELALNGLSISMLPEYGGRISSLTFEGGPDWISQPKAPLVERSVGDNFIRPEISGWDEMIPTTDACQSLDEKHILPDHGEVWSRRWNIESVSQTSATLSVKLKTRTLDLWRKISLDEFGINIEYRITNSGPETVPAFWSAHPLFSATGVREVRIFPPVELIQTSPESGVIEQTFLPQNLPPGLSAEFWCSPDTKIKRVTLKRDSSESLSLSWKPAEVPYFGIFIDNREFSKEMVISPQPSIAYRVSERAAEAAHRIPILAPRQSLTWGLQLKLKR
jgi:hypothetical protein